jgi:hypothetical protein
MQILIFAKCNPSTRKDLNIVARENTAERNDTPKKRRFGESEGLKDHHVSPLALHKTQKESRSNESDDSHERFIYSSERDSRKVAYEVGCCPALGGTY